MDEILHRTVKGNIKSGIQWYKHRSFLEREISIPFQRGRAPLAPFIGGIIDWGYPRHI
jgi:hypothetical protein